MCRFINTYLDLTYALYTNICVSTSVFFSNIQIDEQMKIS